MITTVYHKDQMEVCGNESVDSNGFNREWSINGIIRGWLPKVTEGVSPLLLGFSNNIFRVLGFLSLLNMTLYVLEDHFLKKTMLRRQATVLGQLLATIAS